MNNHRKALTASDHRLLETLKCNMELMALLTEGKLPVEQVFAKDDATTIHPLHAVRMDIFQGELVKINK